MLHTISLTRLYDINRIKTNITHSPGDWMVSAVEHLCVQYYDAITIPLRSSLVCSLHRPLCRGTSPFLSTIYPPDIATFPTSSKSGMLIGYRLIAPMIAQSNSKLASIPHPVLSMGYQNPNMRLSAHIWLRISRRASFNPLNHQQGHQSYLSKRRTAPYAYV
mgnify:CR=1 FL=1